MSAPAFACVICDYASDEPGDTHTHGPLVAKLAETLYERAMEWGCDMWLSWPHAAQEDRAHWLRVANDEVAKIKDAALDEMVTYIRRACPAEWLTWQAEPPDSKAPGVQLALTLIKDQHS